MFEEEECYRTLLFFDEISKFHVLCSISGFFKVRISKSIILIVTFGGEE